MFTFMESFTRSYALLIEITIMRRISVFVCNIKGIVFYEAHVVPDCVILLAEDSFRSKLVIRNTVDPI